MRIRDYIALLAIMIAGGLAAPAIGMRIGRWLAEAIW